jgi:hypothetical protein
MKLIFSNSGMQYYNTANPNSGGDLVVICYNIT